MARAAREIRANWPSSAREAGSPMYREVPRQSVGSLYAYVGNRMAFAIPIPCLWSILLLLFKSGHVANQYIHTHVCVEKFCCRMYYNNWASGSEPT